MYIKEKEICPAYISEINWNCENQIILFMIPNEKKKIFTLLRGLTPKHHSDFYCLNCLHSFRRENKLKSHEKVNIKIVVELLCHQKRIINYNLVNI